MQKMPSHSSTSFVRRTLDACSPIASRWTKRRRPQPEDNHAPNRKNRRPQSTNRLSLRRCTASTSQRITRISIRGGTRAGVRGSQLSWYYAPETLFDMLNALTPSIALYHRAQWLQTRSLSDGCLST